MMPVNMRLGFDQMRAAAVGGHDLGEAFAELMEMAAVSKDMTIVQGGFACLLACVHMIEVHTSVVDVAPGSPIAEFLALSPIARAERADQLLMDNRRSEVAHLAAVLIVFIKPFIALFVFNRTFRQKLAIISNRISC